MKWYYVAWCSDEGKTEVTRVDRLKFAMAVVRLLREAGKQNCTIQRFNVDEPGVSKAYHFLSWRNYR